MQPQKSDDTNRQDDRELSQFALVVGGFLAFFLHAEATDLNQMFSVGMIENNVQVLALVNILTELTLTAVVGAFLIVVVARVYHIHSARPIRGAILFSLYMNIVSIIVFVVTHMLSGIYSNLTLNAYMACDVTEINAGTCPASILTSLPHVPTSFWVMAVLPPALFLVCLVVGLGFLSCLCCGLRSAIFLHSPGRLRWG